MTGSQLGKIVLGLRKNRKPLPQLTRPEHSPLGAPLAEPKDRPKPCPMIGHLRAIGAPLLEDVPMRRRPVPPAPPAFRRKL